MQVFLELRSGRYLEVSEVILYERNRGTGDGKKDLIFAQRKRPGAQGGCDVHRIRGAPLDRVPCWVGYRDASSSESGLVSCFPLSRYGLDTVSARTAFWFPGETPLGEKGLEEGYRVLVALLGKERSESRCCLGLLFSISR